jgi:cytidine deaminase
VNPRHAELVAAAAAARERSYSPYSKFRVGAALRCRDGHVVTATNVENASFGLSICAERAAIARAVAEGRRDYVAIAVVADGAEPTPPCGACRQVLMELAPDLEVVLAGEAGTGGEVHETTIGDLLPAAFRDFPGSRQSDTGGKETA